LWTQWIPRPVAGRPCALRCYRRADRARRAALLVGRAARILCHRCYLGSGRARLRQGMRLGLAPRSLAAWPLLLLVASCVPPAPPLAPPPAPSAAPIPSPSPAPRPAPPRADFTILRGTPVQGGTLLGEAPDTTQALTLDGKPVAIAADGRFLIAFDPDAVTPQHLVATLADGRRVERLLTVAPGSWRIEHINAPWRGSASSDAEFARRRPAELEQIAEARRVD